MMNKNVKKSCLTCGDTLCALHFSEGEYKSLKREGINPCIKACPDFVPMEGVNYAE